MGTQRGGSILQATLERKRDVIALWAHGCILLAFPREVVDVDHKRVWSDCLEACKEVCIPRGVVLCLAHREGNFGEVVGREDTRRTLDEFLSHKLLIEGHVVGSTGVCLAQQGILVLECLLVHVQLEVEAACEIVGDRQLLGIQLLHICQRFTRLQAQKHVRGCAIYHGYAEGWWEYPSGHTGAKERRDRTMQEFGGEGQPQLAPAAPSISEDHIGDKLEHQVLSYCLVANHT